VEARASWGGPTSTGFLLNLDPLPADTAGELVDAFVDGPVSPDLRQRIATQSGGNPLFAQQLVALAREAPEEPLDTPPSLEALIGSRLDRLDAAALRTIRRASVIGRRFALDELADLSPDESPDRALAELERRGLIHRTKEDGLYRFHHALVRDVAYRGTPKVERAELHERAGASLARRDGADELVGYHLEQAFRYVTQVARSDERGRDLAAAGGEYLGRAGIRAWKRADVPAAHNLLGRAVGLLPAGEPKRLELACELGLVLRMRGDLRQADAVLGEAAQRAVEVGARTSELRATIERAGVRAAASVANISETVELAATAIREFEASDDHRSAGRAWVLLGQMRGDFLGDNAALEQAGAKAAEHYRRGGWSPSTCIGQ
jgi:predicted ATPase